MAQYKKNDIKEKIDSVALTVFADEGYKGSKISTIAEKVGISVGNVYRYYKSKEELFYSVVPESFVESLKRLLVAKATLLKSNELKNKSHQSLWLFDEGFIRFMVENRLRLLIILNNSEETKYKHVKTELIKLLINTVHDHYVLQDHLELYNDETYDILEIIYKNLINMTLSILTKVDSMEDIEKHLRAMNTYHLYGITNLFK